MVRSIINMSLLIVGLNAVVHGQSASAAGLPAIFNSIEVRADRQLALPQWRRVLEKIEAERLVYRACAEARPDCTTRAGVAWQAILDELQGQDRLEQVRGINRFVNRIPYQTDMDVWGKSDYWASPLEFLRFNGDCEDYAILKYRSLRQLGVPASDMRMVVVQDTSRNLAHAVLVVAVQGELLVLDNLTNALLPQERTPHYVPYYSVNEESRWAHLGRDGKRVAALQGKLPAR
jgi:predicted transglutaminase-like cysteine proteinase